MRECWGRLYREVGNWMCLTGIGEAASKGNVGAPPLPSGAPCLPSGGPPLLSGGPPLPSAAYTTRSAVSMNVTSELESHAHLL